MKSPIKYKNIIKKAFEGRKLLRKKDMYKEASKR
jgi:hypothetical protein